MEMDFSVLKDPWIAGMVVVATVAIVGLAKSWKKFKDKRAEKEAGASTTSST